MVVAGGGHIVQVGDGCHWWWLHCMGEGWLSLVVAALHRWGVVIAGGGCITQVGGGHP